MSIEETLQTALSTIVVSGADARTYLHGQLSSDVVALTPEQVSLATCNSPQGRVQAILWSVIRPEGVVLLLPTSMLDTMVTRLRKYVLRAKASIQPGEALRVSTLQAPQSMSASGHMVNGSESIVRLPGMQLALRLSPAASSTDFAADAWARDYIAAGLPQVYPQTHETFVAQMLNVDLLGGISFEKGCYTGQEIIARTHYRGSIKRRMFRLAAACAAPLPGTRVLAQGDQYAGDVVDAVAIDGGCELLAVLSLGQLHAPLFLEGGARAVLEQRTMPYAVA